MGHDQRFKELLRLFLRPFLELFFPSLAKQLDLSSPVFVDKELFEDPPEGSHRVADLVAQVRSRRGEPEILLVHIEVQAERKHDVPARMFDYYTLLRRTYRLPVVPLAIYLRGGRAGLTREEYRVSLPGGGRRSRFNTTVSHWEGSTPGSTVGETKRYWQAWQL